MAKNINIKKIISSPVVQAFLIYISGGWIVLEMTDYFISNYDLTERFRDILLILMIVGLPVTLFLTWIFTREKTKEDEKGVGICRVMLKRPWFPIPVVVVLSLLIFSAVRYVYRYSMEVADSSLYPNISDAMAEAEVSLAVLPFTGFLGNSDQDWLIAGQHETLIHELSRISQIRPLRIISRSTVDAFTNYEKPVSEIAREINVVSWWKPPCELQLIQLLSSSGWFMLLLRKTSCGQKPHPAISNTSSDFTAIWHIRLPEE